MDEWSGKKVLVTGSTRGIGKAIATTLASRGAIVGIHGRSTDNVTSMCAEFVSKGFKPIPVAADFSNPETAAETVRAFHAAAGGLDALVNNAGGGRAAAFRSLTIEKWRACFASNLEASFRACQEAYILMRKQNSGSIVNIASLAAHGPGKWMGADYAAAKAGIVSLTKSLAFEAARFGIRVNAVSPGMIETDMTAALTPEMKAGLDIPLGRLGKADEVASVVAYLLSTEASYMTGEVIHVDGGLWM